VAGLTNSGLFSARDTVVGVMFTRLAISLMLTGIFFIESL
jgi:hypothetical protein